MEINKVLNEIIELIEDLAWGRPANEDKLYTLTQSKDIPKELNKLAEVFGLMHVKVSAREYHKDQLIETLQRQNIVLEEARKLLLEQKIHLEAGIKSEYSKNTIIGQDENFRKQVDLALTIAKRPINTMILGPTGAGKEVIAKNIHYNSSRRDAPFIAINCTSIPEAFFESEMFGIEKNIATGVSARKGVFEEASGGTLFLDEIADMSLVNQAKLLRVLEERKVTRVGSVKEIDVDFVLISASHKNFKNLIKEGKFREDLYYRINVAEIVLPALQERKSDILILANYFLARHAKNMMRPNMRLSELVQKALQLYEWPGNVRELNNEMERLAALALKQVVEFTELSSKIRESVSKEIEEFIVESPLEAVDANSQNEGSLSALPVNLEDAERLIIQHVLETCPNKTKAAEKLGITREGLSKKFLRLNLNDNN